MKYPILLHKSKYGYSVSAPSLPGCHSQGKNEREALANIKDAIRVYLTMERQELGAVRLSEVEVALA
ncbi:MAG: type II toxin-antitoxin system HicB family antitoxin [Candidatus Vogelbacteria bacterium]|nr:type II toxin-antitoxin system HicB family antitoxin [Candidatus Vogelbacteria bacterium]